MCRHEHVCAVMASGNSLVLGTVRRTVVSSVALPRSPFVRRSEAFRHSSRGILRTSGCLEALRMAQLSCALGWVEWDVPSSGPISAPAAFCCHWTDPVNEQSKLGPASCAIGDPLARTRARFLRGGIGAAYKPTTSLLGSVPVILCLGFVGTPQIAPFTPTVRLHWFGMTRRHSSG